jgi:50S ribosomal subunit-associated GTPase HflX
MLVMNKIDQIDEDRRKELTEQFEEEQIHWVSAHKKLGFEDLLSAIESKL